MAGVRVAIVLLSHYLNLQIIIFIFLPLTSKLTTSLSLSGSGFFLIRELVTSRHNSDR